MDLRSKSDKRYSRSTCAALALTFSVGVGAGILTHGSQPGPAATAPGALMPAAGHPALDLGAIAIEPGGLELPDPRPARLWAPAGLWSPAGATVLHLGAPEKDPRAVAPAPQALPVMAALRSPAGPTDARGADSLGTGAAHTREAGPGKAVLEKVEPEVQAVTLRRGDTLMDILLRAGIQRQEAHEAVTALEDLYDPRRLRAGQSLQIAALEDTGGQRRLTGLSFDISFEHEILINRDQQGTFAGSRIERPTERHLVHRANLIDDSLYLAAERVTMPPDVTHELIKLFSWDVDFQRDLRAGDAFEALYEEVALADDDKARRGGDLLFAELTVSGRQLSAYRYERSDGTVEYYDPSGRSLRKFLLRTPVDGARISSRFGLRKHPILGYSRMHKGTDFAAPSGTPIFAAGSGRIAVAGRNGGYGNYIRVRHSGEYSTAYAHLSRFAGGIEPGARVRQGQVIGYVGTTGRSTGPHLHYEVLKNGTQINALSLKHPPLAQLAGAELDRFRQAVARIDAMRHDVARGTQLASKAQDSRSAVR